MSQAEWMKNIEARTSLAGTNKLEILLFSLGTDNRTNRKELYGINVFKVREVLQVPDITSAPGMPHAVEGMVSLRGSIIPVIDLGKYIGMERDQKPGILIVTEYNAQVQGFLVEDVDTILRLDWAQMKVPPSMMHNESGSMLTAVTELPDGRLIMMMDVEKILSETTPQEEKPIVLSEKLQNDKLKEKNVFFVDDSRVARSQIEQTLKQLGVNYNYAVNGKQALHSLMQMADTADTLQEPLSKSLHLILTDVEMPEMDGYLLTKQIKSDSRFAGIPIMMHSSLSGDSNHHLGKSVGVDGYLTKFEPGKLADSLVEILLKS